MADRPMHDERHMTSFEALMWNLDADPRLSSTIANLTVLDRRPDWDRLERRLDRAAHAVPRLRRRVVSPPGGILPPRWEPDPDFDLGHHLRRVRLGRRRSRRAMLDLAAEILCEPFDRSRPLWDFVVIEGLADGRAAMLQRLHHAVTDGIGGLRISEQFVDLERDAPEPPPLLPDGTEGPRRSAWEEVGQAVSHLARQQLDDARRRADTARDLVTHPQDLLRRGAEGAGVLRSTVRQAGLTDHRLSPLWSERSLARRIDTIDLPLDRAKAAARALGGTINDLFVTGALAGAGEYHRRAGVEVDELRVAMPVSTRGRDRSAGGNLFSPSQTVLPTGAMAPAERFALVRERLASTKSEPALGAVESLAGALNLLPGPLLVWAGYRASSTVDFVASNLRAAPFDIFLAGALMESNYPLGPLAGTAFNLTTMSYRGTLDMGLVSDPAAIEDPALLVRCIERAYRDLLAAADGERISPRRARP
jgi:WS/DGAT/MGAT family acyltransferase